MRFQLRAEEACFPAIVGKAAGVLRYPASSYTKKDGRRLTASALAYRRQDAYWCAFGREDDWQEKLLDVLERLEKR